MILGRELSIMTLGPEKGLGWAADTATCLHLH